MQTVPNHLIMENTVPDLNKNTFFYNITLNFIEHRILEVREILNKVFTGRQRIVADRNLDLCKGL